MSTVTTVAIGIWNALLLTALAVLIHWRERALQWITEADGESRNLWEGLGDDRWAAFLAEHPELIERCPLPLHGNQPGDDRPELASQFKFASQTSKLAGTIRGSYFAFKNDY